MPPVFRYAPALRELLGVLSPCFPYLEPLSHDNVGLDHRSAVIHEEVVVISPAFCVQNCTSGFDWTWRLLSNAKGVEHAIQYAERIPDY